MSYLTRLSQNVTADSNNTSVANLAAGSTFIGLPTSTLGIAGIQVSMKTDQNCTVFIQQSLGTITGDGTITTTVGSATITGSAAAKFTRDFAVGDQIFIAGEATHYILSITSDTVMTATAVFTGVVAAAYTFYPWDITDTYNYYAITPFGITVQAISSYLRVKVINFSASLTTYFRIQTCLCPIVEAVPRSLDVNGNLKVGSGTDLFNFVASNTVQGETRSVTPIRLVGTQFDLNGNSGAVDANFWTAVVDVTAGPGTVVQANGALTLSSGTNAAAYAKLYSVRRARYIGGNSLRWRANIQLGDTGTTNNTRRWGVAYGATMPTITDGAWFQLSGTTFSIVTKRAGAADTVVSSGSFNGNMGASYALTTTNTVYEIYWTNASVYFVVGGLLLHKVTASTATWSSTCSPYIYMDNVNSGAQSPALTLIARNAVIHRLGPVETSPKWFYQAGANAGVVLKYGPGRLHRVCCNKLTGTTISLYDATSATNPIGIIDPSTGGQEYGLDFYNGLYMVSVGGTCDFTIVYE